MSLMLSRMAFFIQKRNYTLKQIMEFSIPKIENIPKPTPKDVTTCCLIKFTQSNCILKNMNSVPNGCIINCCKKTNFTSSQNPFYQLPNN